MNYDYRVIFQRAGWKQPQHRIFHTAEAMARHLLKLRGTDRDDLDPITRLSTHRRTVGEWEEFNQ
jgi:hypothetical protein